MYRLRVPILALFLAAIAFPALGQKLQTVRIAASTVVPFTLMTDSLNVAKEVYKPEKVLTYLFSAPSLPKESPSIGAKTDGFFYPEIPDYQGKGWLSTYAFSLDTRHYGKVTLKVYGRSRVALFEGAKNIGERPEQSASDSLPAITASLTLRPGEKTFFLRTLELCQDTVPTRFAIEIVPDSLSKVKTQLATDGQKILTPQAVSQGLFLSSVFLSPSGKYLLTTYRDIVDNVMTYSARLYDQKGKLLREGQEIAKHRWMPNEDRLFFVRKNGKKRTLLTERPEGGDERVLINDLPEGGFFFTSKGDKVLLFLEEEGDKKDEKVQFVRDPDDRQPGWRDKIASYMIDIASGTIAPLTFGRSDISVSDIAPDGNILFLSRTQTWDKQPFISTGLMLFHPATGSIDTLIAHDEDLSMATFMPDGRKIVLKGSPNSFAGIGSQLGKGVPGNGYEGELFLFDLKTRSVEPLTKDFDPSVESFKLDDKGNIFFSAENGSRNGLYKVEKGKISKLPMSEELLKSFDVATQTGKLAYIGQSATNSDRLRVLENGREKLLWDLDAQRMKGYIRPVVKDFAFTYKDGTPIEAWYALPPHFDPSKKYPLLVYYYGGTSPSQRYMEGNWSLPMFAAQGYIALSLNPSGSTGYGQEFAARHLNAWGEPTGSEIIACVEAFVKENDFVDGTKIGCFGASYGGFMTQYLISKTNLFAAAISHAGISSISNYWGSGFWGMGYSSVASYGSFPWSCPDMYVKQSPLFRADKINTPLLLLHGDSDTNVPLAESVNLYNALKVLGKDVAFVKFTGEDHGIEEPERRAQWIESMLAWFAKYLQDDPSRWEELYGKDLK